MIAQCVSLILVNIICRYIEYDGWSMRPSKAYLEAHPEEMAAYLSAHPEYAGSNITARRLSSGLYDMSYWHADKYEKYFITGKDSDLHERSILLDGYSKIQPTNIRV